VFIVVVVGFTVYRMLSRKDDDEISSPSNSQGGAGSPRDERLADSQNQAVIEENNIDNSGRPSVGEVQRPSLPENIPGQPAEITLSEVAEAGGRSAASSATEALPMINTEAIVEAVSSVVEVLSPLSATATGAVGWTPACFSLLNEIHTLVATSLFYNATLGACGLGTKLLVSDVNSNTL